MYYVLIAEILTLFLPASRLSYKNAENCMVSNIKTKCTNVKLDNKTHTIDIKKTKMHEEKIKHGHWPINMKPLKVSQVYSWVIINITIIQKRNCFI